MGWWKIEGTSNIVGDDAFDLVRDAFIEVARLYETEFGRMPSREEWQALIKDGLMPITEIGSPDEVSIFAENERPQLISIVLDTSKVRRDPPDEA